MTEMELLIDLHKRNYRQGPGSDEVTNQMLGCLDFEGRDNLQIADIGCGTGASTLALAKQLHGQIVAVDLFSEFLEELQTKAKKLGLDGKIQTRAEGMENLSFEKESLDLIWAEGAIYNMGFTKGIQNWQKFLKPGGYLAVSEISWLTNSRPLELEEHWAAEYSEIDTVSNKIRLIEESGLQPVAHFVLPKSCWLENYYGPLQASLIEFLRRHSDSPAAKRIARQEYREMEMYEKYSDYYSYGFYVARKRHLS